MLHILKFQDRLFSLGLDGKKKLIKIDQIGFDHQGKPRQSTKSTRKKEREERKKEQEEFTSP